MLGKIWSTVKRLKRLILIITVLYVISIGAGMITGSYAMNVSFEPWFIQQAQIQFEERATASALTSSIIPSNAPG